MLLFPASITREWTQLSTLWCKHQPVLEALSYITERKIAYGKFAVKFMESFFDK